MLHGTVEVNHEQIARWQAVRQLDQLGHGPENLYLWTYSELGTTRRTVTGKIAHSYDDGAAVLASKVLAAVAEVLNPV